MEFVSPNDVDYQNFLDRLRAKRFTLREKNDVLLVERFSKHCEKAIKMLVSSSEDIILKDKFYKTPSLWNYRFKEFDYHLSDEKTVGEVKVSFNPAKALQNANKQNRPIADKIHEIGYSIQTIIIDVNWMSDDCEDIIIDDNPLIYLSGYALFKFCLANELIRDIDFYDKMMSEERTNKIAKPLKPFISGGGTTTLGDLFNFDLT